jgi:hypothetical protein
LGGKASRWLEDIVGEDLIRRDELEEVVQLADVLVARQGALVYQL